MCFVDRDSFIVTYHIGTTVKSCLFLLKAILPAEFSELNVSVYVRLLLKCDDTRPETSFRLTAKRTSPFKSTVASVQSTTGS